MTQSYVRAALDSAALGAVVFAATLPAAPVPPPPSCGPGFACIYQHARFNQDRPGAAWPLHPGPITCAAMPAGANDVVSSLANRSGMVLLTYSDGGCGGVRRTYYSGTADNQVAGNDTMSSYTLRR